MTDEEKLQQMRRLGVKWPKGKILPTYSAKMTEEQKTVADLLYDSMSESFIAEHSSKSILQNSTPKPANNLAG